ncbi:MAG: helix-turn-helix transcriptional regulator [Ruminococcus flavefaciens]|nr:helix-turn-helix transcriptional regulator [Eubacterium sp.]MCM1235269.1 helix-turn-helix transcriptional regulator [Ruminococcus flavefaciens]
MTISYNGLWKILIDKNLQRKDLKEALKISSSTFAKKSKGKTVFMDVLMELCKYLNCNIGDVVSFVKDKYSIK